MAEDAIDLVNHLREDRNAPDLKGGRNGEQYAGGAITSFEAPLAMTKCKL